MTVKLDPAWETFRGPGNFPIKVSDEFQLGRD